MMSNLQNRVAQLVPECPFVLIRDSIKWAARKLCEEADVWVPEEEVIVFNADADFPVLFAPYGEPLRVKYLRIDDRKEPPGRLYQQTGPESLEFYQTPKQSQLSGRVAVRPAHGEMVPDDIANRWENTLVEGAAWYLWELPQDWQNFDVARAHRIRFMAGASEAKKSAVHGYGAGGAKVKMRRFF